MEVATAEIERASAVVKQASRPSVECSQGTNRGEIIEIHTQPEKRSRWNCPDRSD